MTRCFRVLLAMAVVCGLTLPATAAAPRLNQIVRQGIQRGTEAELTLTGSNLEDAEELLLYDEGLEVTDFEVVRDNQVKVTVKTAADCWPGAHRVRIRTATGISDMQTVHVGILPIIEEKEPNSSFSEPQPIEKNVTVHGRIDNEDVDYFVIEAKKGERITLEIEGIRLGNTFFDPYIAILNENRFEIASSDDNHLVYQDGLISILAPYDGRYIIEVRDSRYGGGRNSYYLLHVGNFPRPVGIVPSGGKPGETVEVRLLGDPDGEIVQKVKVPKSFPREFGVFAEDERGLAPSPNWFRISPLDNVIEVEPNDSVKEATSFTVPAALNGVLAEDGDVDYFRFAAKKGKPVDIRVFARSLRSALDSVITVYDASNGRRLASNDDSGGPDSYLRFDPPADGEFCVAISDQLGEGGPAWTYRIEVTPVTPDLELTTQEFRQYFQPTVAVPQGGRAPLVLLANRRDFRGRLDLIAEDLPAGVRIETPGMHPSLNMMPVIFHADADAPVAGGMSRLIAKLDDEKQEVTGTLKQDLVLVRGRNQRPVFTETLHQLPVAVIQEMPFEIEVVPPKVPLVQRGSMQLKVIAKRKKDFTAPIQVRLLWNPPGVSSTTSTAIPEGKDDVLLPLNAAANASPGEWKVAVRAEATVDNGPVMVCSQFFDLTVEPAWLDVTLQPSAIEQGQELPFVVTVEKRRDFGKAKVELMGLPNKVTAESLEITSETEEITFTLKAAEDAATGNHQNIFCKVVVTENDEPVLHNVGSGKLRVDKPLPPKDGATAAKPSSPPPKGLSRLEQLRLERQKRLEEANSSGGGGD